MSLSRELTVPSLWSWRTCQIMQRNEQHSTMQESGKCVNVRSSLFHSNSFPPDCDLTSLFIDVTPF